MNQIKAGVILNYIIIILNAVVGLAYTPYMLRCLGQNEYGLYSLVASVIAYLTLLDFGFGNAIVRYTAKFRAEGKQQEQWHMFGMFLIVYSLIGILALLGGLMLYYNVDALFDKSMTASELNQASTMMLLLTFNLAVTFPLSIFGSIISAYEKFIFQRVVSILRLIVSTTVLIIVLSIGFKAVALVVVQTIFNVLTLMLNLIYCYKKLDIHIAFEKFNWPFLKEISVYSFWIFLNAIMDRIYWGTGQFVLGAVSGTVAVAIFSIAILFESMYMTFSNAICNILLPKVTAIISVNCDNSVISDLFLRTGRIQCIIVLLILSGFIIFGKEFISIWAGNGYDESYIITIIFFCSLFVPLIQNTGIIILQARNQLKFRSILYLFISIFSLLFQIILSKIYGAIGCALAIGGALIVGQGIIMNIYYQKVQLININKFWRQILKIVFFPVILTVLCRIIQTKIVYIYPNYLFLSILLYTILYSLIAWKWMMNTYERTIITSIIVTLKNKFSKIISL